MTPPKSLCLFITDAIFVLNISDLQMVEFVGAEHTAMQDQVSSGVLGKGNSTCKGQT